MPFATDFHCHLALSDLQGTVAVSENVQNRAEPESSILMNKTSPSLRLPRFSAVCRALFLNGRETGIMSMLLVLAALALAVCQARATGFADGFETYALGSLDSTDAGGPNEGANGGANPWFGSAPPNLRVVNAENGVTPHSGTNMIRGCYNCLYDNDTDWFNLSFRCATGGVYMGNIALEWWFYDPLGALGGGDYVDYFALGSYSPVPPDTDYSDAGWPNTTVSQRLSLGTDALRFNTNIDATVYQARIVGATDAVNEQGWFNLTNAPRTSGWHHARIVIGAPNGADTQASFYIDDMVKPKLTHGTVNTDGFNIIEVNSDYGNTSGYFDDLLFQDNVSAPTFATGPTNVTVLAGGNAGFTVGGGAGSPAPSYSWQRNGVPLSNGGRISGANTASLAISGVLEGDAGTYSCLVSNLAGVAVATATLSVIVPPTIDSQVPAGGAFSAGSGGTVNLSVTAHATHTINYQWNKNGGPLSNGGHVSGATTSTLTLTGIDATDMGTYSCHLSNADGATDSAAVILTLASGPTIVVQPTPQMVALGSNATFSVTAAGSSLVYRWSKGSTPLNNGGRISGATSSALTISSVIDSDAGSYSCLITNLGGSTNTASVALTVVDPPIITSQPVKQVANIGNTVAFHVTAIGTALSYQWKKNGAVLSNGGDFSGVTTPDLGIHVTTPADEAVYTVTVSNLAASVTSVGAVLRVNQTVTNFFDDFESYSTSSTISRGRGGTPLDYNYGANNSAICPWWGPSPPNFCTYVSGQSGVTAYGSNQMVGGVYDSVNSGDNDETFLNIVYRFNGGQPYYGNIMLDYYFYDPGTPDYGDQISLANFAARVPTNSDASGFQIPASPVQNLFVGAWQNLDTTKYQAGMMGATEGSAGRLSKNITGTTYYFDTPAARSQGWHHARIVVGPADPATHVAYVQFFVDDLSNAAFTRNLPPGNVGFNAIHLLACSIFPPATTETAGFFDSLSFLAENDPYIIQQPVSLTNNYGTTATFSVVAMATGYQWFKNGGAINGATNTTLTLNGVSSRDQGSYYCVVTGANGSLPSSTATLTVLGSPPFLTATQIGANVVITWSGSYPLLSAPNVTGPYTVVAGATSPYTNSAPLASRRFFGLGN
jgi:hypothetical protein